MGLLRGVIRPIALKVYITRPCSELYSRLRYRLQKYAAHSAQRCINMEALGELLGPSVSKSYKTQPCSKGFARVQHRQQKYAMHCATAHNPLCPLMVELVPSLSRMYEKKSMFIWATRAVEEARKLFSTQCPSQNCSGFAEGHARAKHIINQQKKAALC